MPGISGPNSPANRPSCVRSDSSASPAPGYWTLTATLPAVVPHRPVHLPDRGGRGRLVLELLEQVAPVLAEPLGQHLVHRARPAAAGPPPGAWSAPPGRARRPPRAAPTRRPTGPARTSSRRPSAPRAAEELLGGALLELAARRSPPDLPPSRLPSPQRGPPGEAQRQRGQLAVRVTALRGRSDMRPSISQTAVPQAAVRRTTPPVPRHPVTPLPRPAPDRSARPVGSGRWPARAARAVGSGGRQRTSQWQRGQGGLPAGTRVERAARPSRNASAWAAASPATAVASAMSQAGTARRRRADRHCTSIRGQAGSRSTRSRSMHPAHAVDPGSTSGPTSPVPSSTPAYRCGTPAATSRPRPPDPARRRAARPGARPPPGPAPAPAGSASPARGGRAPGPTRAPARPRPRRRGRPRSPAGQPARRHVPRLHPAPVEHLDPAHPGRRQDGGDHGPHPAAPAHPHPYRPARGDPPRRSPPGSRCTTDSEPRSGRSRSSGLRCAAAAAWARGRPPWRRRADRPPPAVRTSSSARPVRQPHPRGLGPQQLHPPGPVDQVEERAASPCPRGRAPPRAPGPPRTAPSRSRQARASAGFTIGYMSGPPRYPRALSHRPFPARPPTVPARRESRAEVVHRLGGIRHMR